MTLDDKARELEHEDPALLPTYSHEQRLENESLDELRPLLRRLFVVRDQRQQDFGVDLTLELLLGTHASNYTATVQVKARSGLSANQDGSISLRVESQNIEYLLNAASSTVILYDADRHEFRWGNVLDEVFALRDQGINYRDQTKVTLRFSKQLRADTLDAFHAGLLAELRTARQLRMQVAALAPGEVVVVESDGRSTTSSDLEREFFEIGWDLASHGAMEEVATRFSRLAPSVQNQPRARLIMALAHASNGQAISAWSHANEARRGGAQLSHNELDLLELIEIRVDDTLGRGARAELASREEKIRLRAAPSLRIQLEVSALRHAVTLSGDPARFGEFARAARELIASTTTAVGPTHAATLSARVLEVEIAGHDIAYRYGWTIMTSHLGETPIGRQMRGGVSSSAAMHRMSTELNSWLRGNGEVKQAVSEWPLLLLELEKVELLVQLVLLRYTRLLGVRRGIDARIDLARPPASELRSRLNTLSDLAKRLRVDDIEVRARIMLLELLELGDDAEGVRLEATALADFCHRTGHAAIEQEARAHLAGKSLFREARRELLNPERMTADAEFADASPEQRSEHAERLRAALNLPSNRLPHILDEIERAGEVAILQREWCRHFKMQEHLGHTQSEDTLYARPPQRRCLCDERGVATMFPLRDWRALIKEFRRAHCERCDRRSPNEAGRSG